MAKPEYKKRTQEQQAEYEKQKLETAEVAPEVVPEIIPEVVEVPEVVTNTVVEAPAVKKIIFPEDMDSSMKLEDPKPVVIAPVVYTSTGQKVVIKSAGYKELIGKEGEVLEVRGTESVVLVGPNKYLIANDSLEKI